MKKIGTRYIFAVTAIFLFFAAEVNSQHYIGVRGGIGSGSSRFYPQQEMGTVWGLYSGGISWKYFTVEKYVGGVEIDMLYMQQGYKQFRDYQGPGMAEADTTAFFERKINTVMVPLFWQPHAYLFRRSVRVYANLGLTFSYNVSSSYREVSGHDGMVYNQGTYEMNLTRDNRWCYGLCGGFGIGVSKGRFEFMAEGRYYIGYGDILRNYDKYQGNPRRSPLDGMQLHFGVYYRLGKGGILSDPSKKTADRMAERQVRKMAADSSGASAAEEDNITVNQGIVEENRTDVPGPANTEKTEVVLPEE